VTRSEIDHQREGGPKKEKRLNWAIDQKEVEKEVERNQEFLRKEKSGRHPRRSRAVRLKGQSQAVSRGETNNEKGEGFHGATSIR